MSDLKNELTDIASLIREYVIRMAVESRSPNVGSSLSIIEILTVLYFRILNINPELPNNFFRDRFILSKGHGGAALYATLAVRGYFSVEKLNQYLKNDGGFHIHPAMDSASGIEVSTGSLGHGLSIAAGIAYIQKNTNVQIVVLLGDGECNEGSIWEAAMFIATHQLNNITVIIDNNNFQGFGRTNEVHPSCLNDIWRSFKWNVLTTNGHDMCDMENAMRLAIACKRPSVILAKTIIGKGITCIENTLSAHYEIINKKFI